MPEEYKTLLEGGVGEVTEKKSRFIATAMPVNSEEEAVLFIESINFPVSLSDIICYNFSHNILIIMWSEGL